MKLEKAKKNLEGFSNHILVETEKRVEELRDNSLSQKFDKKVAKLLSRLKD